MVDIKWKDLELFVLNSNTWKHLELLELVII